MLRSWSSCTEPKSKRKNEVVLYFADAKPSTTAAMPSKIWMFDERHMILLRQSALIGPAREQIHLKVQS